RVCAPGSTATKRFKPKRHVRAISQVLCPSWVVSLCLSSRPTTKEPAKRETEEEWRVPEGACITMPMQGVRPKDCPRNRISRCPVFCQMCQKKKGGILGRTPSICLPEDTASGSLHSGLRR